GAGSWVPEFTIIAPSGAIEAFGPGDGDGCSITWTATEEGEYLVVINEAGECGGGPNTGTNNGYPAITCNSGAPCDATPCNAGTFSTNGETVVCGTDATVDLMTDENEVSFPPTGGFGWLITNSASGGTGGPAGDFILTGAPYIESYNSDLNGVLAANFLPVLEGNWVIKGAVYESSADPFNTICATTTDSLIVTFANDVPTVDNIVDNGDGSATVTASGGATPYTYEWSDGQTTATATGLTTSDTYTVTVTDANGCTVESSIDVIGTSVSNIANVQRLEIGPNPTQGLLQVQLQLSDLDPVRVEILNTQGQQVYMTDLGETLLYEDQIDLRPYANGLYFVRLTVGDASTTERILLMH
ncbi:MAG: T9SS type A sorting domain-containing protein, partial [Phaeodactylibacter sp.]|nr:T9SS type A sorting domain-containing protein [Phaeodactylibacter sp.]